MPDPPTPALSVVLPVYNERPNLAPLLGEIARALAGRAYEVVAVDDASSDGSGAELVALRARYPGLRVHALAERGGQSAALAAGWDAARGSVIATLDADGQNDPADLPRLLAALEADAGLAAVVGIRTARRDSWWKLVQSRIANTFRDRITGHRVRDTGCGLKVLRRASLARLPRFDGMHRFLPTLIALNGERLAEAAVAHRPRAHGRTKYGVRNRLLPALRDAFGVRWLARRRLTYQAREVE